MNAQQGKATHVANTRVENVRNLLDSPDPRDRVRAVHHRAAGIQALERGVLLDAQDSGMTWAEIGNVYGVSRQAAHRRFSDKTVVPTDYFGTLLKELDEDGEVVAALTRAADRARHAAASGR